MAVFTQGKLSVPALLDTEEDTKLSIASAITDSASDNTSVDLSDDYTETESVCAPTLCNTPTSELLDRSEVRPSLLPPNHHLLLWSLAASEIVVLSFIN